MLFPTNDKAIKNLHNFRRMYAEKSPKSFRRIDIIIDIPNAICQKSKLTM